MLCSKIHMKKRGKRMMGKVKKIVAIVMMACMLFTMTNVNSDAGNASGETGIMLCGENVPVSVKELE